MAATTALSVPEWMKVRNAVAATLRTKSSSVKTIDMAEALLMQGWIDVDAVLADLTPPAPEQDDAPTEE